MLNLLHRHVLKEVLVSTALAMGLFVFVLLLGNAMRDIAELVAAGKLDLMVFLKLMGLLIPWPEKRSRGLVQSAERLRIPLRRIRGQPRPEVGWSGIGIPPRRENAQKGTSHGEKKTRFLLESSGSFRYDCSLTAVSWRGNDEHIGVRPRIKNSGSSVNCTR